MSRKRGSRFPIDFTLDRHTAHGILTVAIFSIAALLFLSLFDLAGRFGLAIDRVAANALGWERLFLPFFLFAIGIHEVSPQRLPLKASNSIGFILFFFSLNPFIQTIGAAAGPTSSPEHLGGKLGMLLSDPAVALLGRAGAGIVFGALTVIALLLIFNTSIRRFVEHIGRFMARLFGVLRGVFAPFRWIARTMSERREAAIRNRAVMANVQSVAEPERLDVLKQANVAVGGASQVVKSNQADPTNDEEAETEGAERRTHIVQPKPKRRRLAIQIPLELLMKRDQRPTSGDIQHNQHIIRRTLETFGIQVEMGDVAVGPTVTQFTLKPSEGVKISRITGLHNDLALALAAHPIRIEAPIPGKSLVGVEVPNQSVATVGLREMFDAKEWKERRSSIPFALGRDVSGRPWIADIGRMPHLLVAGATGSGKSVCLNDLIVSFLYSFGPDDLKMILVDPKRVELQVYNGVPHLITPVITDVEKTVNALKWTLREMDRRFDILSKFGARDIASYNERSEDKLPFIVFIIDELADLMVTAMQEVEGPIVRLAQMSRAVGIHLVLATQRPSVDVITGLIKANIPARIAFAVASSTDSRTILDSMGAEKLLGRGDMLFQTAEMSTPKRLQGAYVSDEEIARVVEFLKTAYEPTDYDPAVVEKQGMGSSFLGGAAGGDDGDSDPLLSEAKEEIIRAGKASASLLQRRLKVGYARAARILDLLEHEGFIGPGEGAKPREILKADFTNQREPLESEMSHPALEQVNREMPVLEQGEE